uniref:Tudor domain-containing protein n=1 Tax=Hippocampus comes TaxID=109280 RepID=A0A3Q2Z490_HIPCM
MLPVLVVNDGPLAQVESSLPEDGVLGLQEDARIIGLIYAAKMNKKRRSVQPYLCMSCSLEDFNGHVLYSKRRDMQLSKLNRLDAHFSSTHTEVCRVKARLASLETAVQKAKKVRSVPFLELYSDWQQILRTLQAPVDNQSFNMKCITMGCGLRFVTFGQSNQPVAQWVVVTHVVNPAHFYVRYAAEKRESDILSKEVNAFCKLDTSCFSSADNVRTGVFIFFFFKSGLWCRTSVLEVFQNGCNSSVDVCPVDQVSRICVFFIDYGFTKIDVVNNHLRKIHTELVRFAPQAIRCSLKDLVPYDLVSAGWSKEAQTAFCQVVGSALVEMTSFGQDRDALLVDLSKAPVGPSNDIPISIRDYLVFIEVARFYYPVKPSRKQLKYYPAVPPKLHTEHSAVVTHVNSPDDFYIQLTDNMESSLLKAKLQECYNAKSGEGELLVYCPIIGQACVARFEENVWYRAEVIGHLGDRKVEVRCIDFGFKTTVLVSDLRKIKDEFFSLPALCCLSDVLPLAGETWSDACVKRFFSLAHDKFFTMVVTGEVNLSKLSLKTNMAEVPANDGAIWDPPLDLSGLEPLDPTGTAVEFQPRLSLPGSLKDAKVRVSHITSPSSFYIQFIQNDSQLKRLKELLNEECELLEPQDVAWEPDMFCAAHVNQVWERGLICSKVSSADIAEVMRCDHGNKVKLHVSNLRPLSASLEGSFALECSLTDIKPAGGQPTWTATACDFMRDYLSGASAVMTDERPVAVTLMCTHKMGELVSISDHLACKGLALRERKPVSETPKCTVLKPQPPTSVNMTHGSECCLFCMQVKTDMYKPPELPQLGHNRMTISAIREDGLIYARTDTAGCHLEQLRDKIQQSMKTLPNQKPYTWKTVQGCAVIGPDMLWYRGQLLEVQGGHVKVQYVDYGQVENIPVVHVYPCLLCEDIPQLCMACQLYAIKPVRLKILYTWHHCNTADDRVVAFLSSELFWLTTLSVLVVNEVLIFGVILGLKSLSVVAVRVEGLLGPQEVMLGPFSEPGLPEDGQRLNVRGPCLAEYIDGNFYRAKMLKIISADPVQILIQHVDFGSNDTVPTNRLRQMPAKLLRFPVQALKVRVAGLKAPSTSTEDQVLPYSPQWTVKATLAMIDLLLGDLTAVFQPSVSLYNQEGEFVFLPLLASGLAQHD